MNQILFTNEEKLKKNKNERMKNIKIVKSFRITFIISISVLLVFLSYYIYNHIISNNKKDMSVMLLNSFNVQRLYSNEENYTTITLNNNENFFVIGNIEIPSIQLNYPILSDTNDELLKIAPCRFYGPYPNEIGNLCIAAHNYDDNRFFSNLYKLNIEDKIIIYDHTNCSVTYYIYDKYETNKNDTSCTSQDTYGVREITLVTCNNLNGNRLIIKAKE